MTVCCPECQKEMARVGNFWFCGNHTQPIALPVEEVLTVAPAHPLMPLVDGLSTPLALPIAEYLAESSPFIALHRLADAAELITRFFAIVALSDVYRRLGDFPPSLKRELPEKLARPTFGAWRDIAAAALRFLKEQRQACFLAELPAFWRERWQPLVGGNDGNPEREILALRNNLAHAGRLPDATAATLLGQHRLRFSEALQQLSFLADYRLFATLKEGEAPLLLRGLPRRDDWSLPRLAPGEYPENLRPQQVYFLRGNETLNLFPLHSYDVVMLWREEEQVFHEVDRPAPMLYLRYNDRHGRQMLEFTALAPQTSFAQRGEDFRQAFLSVFNLPEWRRQREEEEERHSEWQREVTKWGYDFRDLIPDLIEGMVGREAQVEQAKKWIRAHQQTGGILWIGGKPGVGKSALMAELARRLKDDGKLCAVPFFFRSGDRRCSPDHFYHAAILQISEKFGLQVQADLRESRQVQFGKVLDAVRQKQLQESRTPTVLFLLDGLDEVAGQHPDFARLPLSLQHPYLIWICAGRGEPPLNEIFNAKGVERLWENGELPPLTDKDVRALIEQECDRLRYELFKRDEPVVSATARESKPRPSGSGEQPGSRNPFIEELAKRSERLPLYVRLVIEDLKSGRLNFQEEGKLPEGLPDYFERILERLKVGDIPQKLTDVLALLCWAYEPLSEEMFCEVLRPLYAYAIGWERRLMDALRYGHVMLRRAETPERTWGWSLYHESFRRHLQETSTIHDARERAHHLLLEWCSRWVEHKNPYALRHYAEHLQEGKRWDELYALARSESFLQAQAGTLTDEPDAPLRTLQTALEGAMAQDDAGKMGEFCLAHARRLIAITQESPLDALRAGNLDRAWALADLFEIERGALWYLLFARELKDTGRLNEARATLERLQIKELPRLWGWQGECAAYLLAHVFEINEEASLALYQQLLSKIDQCTLCKHLAVCGHFSASFKITQQIKSKDDQAKVLATIATAQAEAGEKEEAGATFAAALEITREIEEKEERALALVAIAAAQSHARMKDMAEATFAAALEAVREIEEEGWRLLALRAIAVAQAQAGNFATALEIVQEIEEEWLQAEALRAIAAAQDQTGVKEIARINFAAALETAQDIKEEWRQAKALALAAIAVVQAQTGVKEVIQATFDAALEITRKIKEEEWRAKVLVAIAASQAQTGVKEIARINFAAALEIAHDIKEEWRRSETLASIATSQAQTGDVDASLVTACGIKEGGWRAKALTAIAETQAQIGKKEVARGTFAAALETARKIEQEEWRTEVLTAIAVTQAETGDLDAAFETTWKIEGEESWSEALASIALVQAQMGDFDTALETAREIEEKGWRAIALSYIAVAHVQAGKKGIAGAVFSDIIQTAWEIKEKGWRVFALRVIAKAQAQTGEKEAAGVTFGVALDTAREIEVESWRAGEMAIIAAVQAQVGFCEQAVATAEAILTDRNKHLPEIATTLAKAGDKENFKHLLIPCAYYLDAAYRMCGLLARLYPEQASVIAEVVKR